MSAKSLSSTAQLSLAEQDVNFILQREERHETKLELGKGARVSVEMSI